MQRSNDFKLNTDMPLPCTNPAIPLDDEARARNRQFFQIDPLDINRRFQTLHYREVVVDGSALQALHTGGSGTGDLMDSCLLESNFSFAHCQLNLVTFIYILQQLSPSCYQKQSLLVKYAWVAMLFLSLPGIDQAKSMRKLTNPRQYQSRRPDSSPHDLGSVIVLEAKCPAS